MKHHRVLRSFGFYALALWNWFPLFVRLAKSRTPSSGKIVGMLVLVPSDCQKFSEKDSTDPLTPANSVCEQHRVHQTVSSHLVVRATARRFLSQPHH